MPSRDRGAAPAGFDFSGQMRLLCQDMVVRLPELAHIDLERVAVGFCQARSPQRHGLKATLTPLRFASGALVTVRHGRPYTMQRFFDPSGIEILYLLSFYLPRFLDDPFEEKVVTILHELWHISPSFDGDLRRFHGRCYAHGPSQKAYDERSAQLATKWLSQAPQSLYAFLTQSYDQLKRCHGRVYGLKFPAPKLLPVAS